MNSSCGRLFHECWLFFLFCFLFLEGKETTPLSVFFSWLIGVFFFFLHWLHFINAYFCIIKPIFCLPRNSKVSASPKLGLFAGRCVRRRLVWNCLPTTGFIWSLQIWDNWCVFFQALIVLGKMASLPMVFKSLGFLLLLIICRWGQGGGGWLNDGWQN